MKRTPEKVAVNGIIGTLVIALVVLAALNVNRLPLIGSNDVIRVQFAEAGGLRGGDDVLISGARVGKVRDVRIDGTHVVADIVLSDRDVRLGDRTGARIVTVTLLGRAAIQLDPQGSGRLEAGDLIPAARTSSPYNLTSTLGELTDTSAAIDKARLARALEAASSTLNSSRPDLGPALDGIIALSSAVSENDDELHSLVAHADSVTGVLAARDQQIASLLGAGHSLLAELDTRQATVVSLLHSARSLAAQLRGTLKDTDGVLGPALAELDRVVDLLNENRKNLQASITGLRGYATGIGESLASGPWLDIYIQNLTSPASLAPIVSGVIP